MERQSVIVKHRKEWARGTKVAGLAGRSYDVDDGGRLCVNGSPDHVHPDDVAEFRQFGVFAVEGLAPPPTPAPPAPPPPPAPVAAEKPKKRVGAASEE